MQKINNSHFQKQSSKWYLLLFTTLFACNNIGKKESDIEKNFPKVQSVLPNGNTDFVATLDGGFPKNKNVVYATTLCAAWDTALNIFPKPFAWINKPPDELAAIASSNLWQNSLLKSDYTCKIDNTSDGLSLLVKFYKQFKFREKFIVQPNGIKFLGKNVKSFGWTGNSNSSIEILFYHSDTDFGLRLHTLDTSQELILIMDPQKHQNFQAVWQHFLKNRNTADAERIQALNEWKYAFSEEDELMIPYVGFNLEKNFGYLCGTTFKTGNEQHSLQQLKQRNAFVMDETGVQVESEVQMLTDSAGVSPITPPKPQHLIFNRPFYIFMKRNGNFYPFFAVYIQNPALLTQN